MEYSDLVFEFSIDRGGTFTDVFCQIYQANTLLRSLVYKLLSENPSEYEDAPREGIRRILTCFQEDTKTRLGMSDESLSQVMKCTGNAQDKVDSSQIRSIRMGTTVATNALLERKGAKTGLLITKGFRDVLQIGNQSRLKIFDLQMAKTEALYSEVAEIQERVRVVGKQGQVVDTNNRIEQAGHAQVEIVQELNEQQVEQEVMNMVQAGVESIAIVLVNGYLYHSHELKIKEICTRVGAFKNISTSHEVMSTIKLTSRGCTTTVDAYLNPHILQYIHRFRMGFMNAEHTQVFFMQSDGGLTGIDHFRGSRSILSGPAGGVVGLVQVGNRYTDTQVHSLLGFDMGGTSTDVSRWAGRVEHIYDNELAGIQISTPHIDIHTVAAGGGSRLYFQGGLFQVGPHSSGAYPGPVCYANQGHLSVTDANLLLGRLQYKYFPSIFGPQHNQPLSLDMTKQAFMHMQTHINTHLQQQGLPQKSIYDIAQGFLQVANENMCRAIRNVTQGKGVDPAHHLLVTFGGAAGQHCSAISDRLGIKKVFVHQHAGILSAYGLSLAPVVHDTTLPVSNLPCDSTLPGVLEQTIHEAQQTNLVHLSQYNLQSDVLNEVQLGLKYSGTDTVLMIPYQNSLQECLDCFYSEYKQQFGFNLTHRTVLVENLRVRSSVQAQTHDEQSFHQDNSSLYKGAPESLEQVYLQQNGELVQQQVPVYLSSAVPVHSYLDGPALVVQHTSTVVVESQWRAHRVQDGLLLIKQDVVQQDSLAQDEQENDPIKLAIFGNRFMSIAEQMGKALQRTSVSVNIKERLDFSCALFDSQGQLVANAPHLPVHLGSMSWAVQFQIQYRTDWQDQQSILSNHPQAGGSHLPDLTVITPVYSQGQVLFYVASRGHHSDVGGITPGSMPAFSKSLKEEGLAVKSFLLCDQDGFKEKELRNLLEGQDGQIGSRNKEDNISDLKAQLSANYRGVQLVQALISEVGQKQVLGYMVSIQSLAKRQVQDMLCELSLRCGMAQQDTLYQEDRMDDGTCIRLRLTIDRSTAQAIFDFRESDDQIQGNTNCPKSVVYSAILYSLRCLVDSEIPLNQGCLQPIQVLLREGSVLSPEEHKAIVGGNVLTSQTITDCILRCFQAVANSYGCMNNFTFGNASFGYYETICGGSGAGPTFNGTSAVQAHMTNTRITDVEVLETRFPVMLDKFSIRGGSGGQGQYTGGNGVVRQFRFLEDDIQVSVLTERRVRQPQGLNGGGHGMCGNNQLIKKDGEVVDLGSKKSLVVGHNDVVVIMTPGGGGYGPK